MFTLIILQVRVIFRVGMSELGTEFYLVAFVFWDGWATQ